MDIQEMHVLFRQLAQQMGMQTVRSLTSEQVDVLLNSSIKDVLSDVVRGNVKNSADGQTNDNYKLGPINSLGVLYKRQVIDLIPEHPNATSDTIDDRIFMLIASDGINKMTTDFYRDTSVTRTIATIADYFYIVGFKLEYSLSQARINGLEDIQGDVKYKNPTSRSAARRFLPVDIIDEQRLYDNINDEHLKPSLKHPCIVMYTNENGKQFDLYMGDFTTNGSYYSLDFGNIPTNLIMSYIGIPAIVHRKSTTQATDVDVNTDMPIHLHEIIVKHAVDLFIKTLSKVPFASQQQQSQQ